MNRVTVFAQFDRLIFRSARFLREVEPSARLNHPNIFPRVCYIMAFILFSGCGPRTAHDAAKPGSEAQRVVVIGDIHADLGTAREAFRLAGGIDEAGKWVGEKLTIVQLGDMIGRSYEDREVLDFIQDVGEDAQRAGGAVYVLVGNHEVFAAQLRYDYVHENAYAAFEAVQGLDFNNDLLAQLPEEARARGAALMPGGPYAKRLAEFSAVLQLGETIFVHGGVTPYWAEYGIERINEEVSRWFAGETGQPVSAQGVDAGNLDDNVMMSRHFSDDVDASACELLERSLQILGARRMVVAHTVQDSITSNCDERVWAIDVGMSRVYGGDVQVLEILDDETVSVISP